MRLSASQHRLEFWLHGHVVIWVPFYFRFFDAWLLHRMAVQLTARCFDQMSYQVALPMGLRFARPREYLLQLRELFVLTHALSRSWQRWVNSVALHTKSCSHLLEHFHTFIEYVLLL